METHALVVFIHQNRHIRKASFKLNYDNSIPFQNQLFSKHDKAIAPHPATISMSELLTCTTHPRSVFSELADKHKIWLGKATVSPSSNTTYYASDPAARLHVWKPQYQGPL